jgi:nicotinate-nucleotide pyrophosphorylase (carboxylating)
MISASLTKKIESYGIQVDTLLKLISIALDEDAPDGIDKTSQAAIPLSQSSKAEMRARKSGVVAGAGITAAVFESLGLKVEIKRNSGELVEVGGAILVVSGNTREILLGERTALNFISHLSGIATLTRKWVDEIAGTGAIIRDTRKTTPGLRQLEKFAVRMGGGMNHRMHLSDAAMVKDNHVAAAGSITGAVDRIRSEFPDLQIEVEVDDLTQLKEALTVNADVIMLDNMDLEMTREAVALAKGSNSKLESSGGISFDRARAYAETGVNYLAIGALTHSAPILDIGLDF